MSPLKAGSSEQRTISAQDLSDSHSWAGLGKGLPRVTPPVRRNRHSLSSIFPLSTHPMGEGWFEWKGVDWMGGGCLNGWWVCQWEGVVLMGAGWWNEGGCLNGRWFQWEQVVWMKGVVWMGGGGFNGKGLFELEGIIWMGGGCFNGTGSFSGRGLYTWEGVAWMGRYCLNGKGLFQWDRFVSTV